MRTSGSSVPDPDESPAAPSEEKLAHLLAELTEELRRGRSPDVEKVASEHPSLAEELRKLWAAALVAEEMARSSAAASASAPPPGAGPEEPSPPRGFEDYEIVQELGRGGMGVVYKARQASLGRMVALKTMRGDARASAADRARFRAEAESAARLDHPHIVPVYEVGVHEGTPFFSMRLVEGTTLARRLAEGPLDPREAAALLVPVCRTIEYAHQQGILHRDLKPSNVLIDGEGTPYVTDFGLAKRLEGDSSLTMSGAILGTPAYMSPEQAGAGGPVGRASDVYGLGAILYHMTTGRPPFQAATPVDAVLLVRGEDPLPPRLLNRRVDRDLEMIALRCLQKPPELRYSSAQALADDLSAYLAGEPIAAGATGLRYWVSRTLRETHHAVVLENWGLLWMWHSVVVFVLCVLTNALQWTGVGSIAAYFGIWTLGFGAWAAIFWALRRRAGPITFVERQIAHVWGFSVLSSILLFFLEILMRLDPLTLSPILGLLGGSVFVVKAGILSGRFYFQAAALYLTAAAMALWPDIALTLFGVVTGVCFFVPGLKYHRQRRRMASAMDPP